ncbi:MAG TPA: hypothetical protein PLI90_07185 [Rhodocyclaceae bacterium]|nr:hypothetical protein [Rhodocyclaceae bacterium]
MLLLRAVLAFLAILLSNITYASDWQYAGYVKEDLHQFFDAESLTHPTKDVTRVWVKSIQQRRFDHYSKTHEKLVVEKAARKIAFGYSPKFLELQAIKGQYETTALRDAIVGLTTQEVMANEPDIQTFSKFYFEIDCAKSRIKLLSGVMYTDNGKISSKKVRPDNDYAFIIPDSNGQWLSVLVCLRN